MLDSIAASKAQTGPSKLTRSQVKLEVEKHPSSTTKASGPTGRLNNPTDSDSPLMNVTIADGVSSMAAISRWAYGSDESLVSPRISKAAILQGIGKFCKISSVELRVPLKTSADDAATFSFSRTWTAPRTMLHLSGGQLCLANVTYLVADKQLTSEEPLLGLPGRQRLHVDTRTLLESKRAFWMVPTALK